jgi:hypothetical protein
MMKSIDLNTMRLELCGEPRVQSQPQASTRWLACSWEFNCHLLRKGEHLTGSTTGRAEPDMGMLERD